MNPGPVGGRMFPGAVGGMFSPGGFLGPLTPMSASVYGIPGGRLYFDPNGILQNRASIAPPGGKLNGGGTGGVKSTVIVAGGIPTAGLGGTLTAGGTGGVLSGGSVTGSASSVIVTGGSQR